MIEINNNSVKLGSKNRYNDYFGQFNSGKQTASDNKYAYVKFNWIIVLPALVAALCYSNGLNGDFVHDDKFAIKENRDVLGDTPVSQLFLNDFWGRSMSSNKSHKSYRPLTVLSFRLNYFLTGRDTFYFHLVNVILHALVTSLFAFTCKDAFGFPDRAVLMAGLLFAVHPIHTEAVTGLVGRADVMSALFFLLSFLAYHRSIKSPSTTGTGLFCVSLVCAGTAMLCKETGVTALGVCFIVDVFVISKDKIYRSIFLTKSLKGCRPVLLRGLVVLSYTTCLLLFRVWMMAGNLPNFQIHDNPASFQSSYVIKWLSYGYIWTMNAWLLLAPINLSYDWQHGSIPLVESFLDYRNLATLLTGTVFATLMIRIIFSLQTTSPHIRARDPLLLAVVFTVVPFLPASNIFFRVGFVLAERILYIPSMGFCACVGIGLYKLMARWQHYQSLMTSSFIFLLIMHAGKTWQQNKIWESREALFRSGIVSMPHNSKMHYNYANFLKDTSQLEEARYHYEETIRLDKTYASAYNNLGTLLDNSLDAETYFRKTLELLPKHQGAHINLGTKLFKRGEIASGIDHIRQAVEIDNTNPEALTSLAWVLTEVGNLTEAEEYVKMAIRQKPDYFQALVQYGSLLKKAGRHAESAMYYDYASDLNPSQSVTLLHAAHSYSKMGSRHEAEVLLKRAIGISRDVEALEQLAVLYFHTGRSHEALSLYEEIDRTQFNSSESRVRYGKVLASSKQYQKAEHVLTQALAADDTNIDGLKTLSQVLIALGRQSEALRHLNRAIYLHMTNNNPDTELAELLFTRGSNYIDTKQYEEALEDFNKVVAIDPDHKIAHGNLGTIYHLQRKFAKARYHYSECLRLDPGNTVIKENLVKLDRSERSRTPRQNTGG